jgi:hypothetical protein
LGLGSMLRAFFNKVDVCDSAMVGSREAFCDRKAVRGVEVHTRTASQAYIRCEVWRRSRVAAPMT